MLETNKKNNINIAERFSVFFKATGITQEEFSKRIGASRSSISSWQRGRFGIPGSVIKTMEYEFNLNPVWLITGEGEMISQPEQNKERNERLGAEFRILQLLRKRPLLKLTVDDFLELDRDLSEEERGAIKAMLKSWKPVNTAK
ncbi:DNA-binding helix-turn-helix protein [Leptospira weilii str. 2006001853]|uniref:DNA-binding helix-turn-helix protein n=2 Tax=Leptospira weilii TaxID=28184 RepID=A0A828Z4N0_9LEPT|nr:helix-turn-helix domain-containing protein [Leptospira weilii]EKR62348.1 DNA-binding helix-turn-helix protein [Leptospira weilii str. 2006001853]EKR64582.1 DNA-binding helix-turn-helix protein [Leptospira weilii str. 2006001853]EKR66211.1 DNA-binding helix-turn-helix protein [Leptospira weilii str. 2006001853]QDK22970.1 helix-turn-helix transcriptional regulator [Leptospira weilii]QDK27386.1 helix-turn-helix transcriptional regulator [Leptospira weilii]